MADGRYHHGDLRSALLDAAEALIRERGLDGWSLREASVRVGVSPSAAYHHFDSREALVQALCERLLSALGERLARAANRAQGGRARLIAFGRSYVRWALEDPAITSLAFDRGKPPEAIRAHPRDVLAAELDRLVNDGTLPAEARPGAQDLIWAGVHGIAVLSANGHLRARRPRDVDREVERLLAVLLTGLSIRPP